MTLRHRKPLFRAPFCPYCESGNTVVSTTVQRVRYCYCRDCDRRFRAVGDAPDGFARSKPANDKGKAGG